MCLIVPVILIWCTSFKVYLRFICQIQGQLQDNWDFLSRSLTLCHWKAIARARNAVKNIMCLVSPSQLVAKPRKGEQMLQSCTPLWPIDVSYADFWSWDPLVGFVYQFIGSHPRRLHLAPPPTHFVQSAVPNPHSCLSPAISPDSGIS